jgi:DNA primase
MYNKSILTDIKDRISIVSYIGERISLKKTGRNFLGLCPFHNEKTPSFNVSEEKQIYHCFGCGAGGDIFEFVMKFENQEFPEAVRHLATIAGVALPVFEKNPDNAEDEARLRKRKWCLRINEIARDFFAEALGKRELGNDAREYLKNRGISKEFLTQHFLGFADNSWDSLTLHLEAKKVPLELACELGLVRKRDTSGYYDFFRNRIMFPITSPRGDVIGFGGRALGEDEQAKYMNSPDSLIYHKSGSVYGLDKAAPAIRDKGFVILVEGYMDALSLMQEGIDNVVAPLGTALTEGHLRLVGRYSRNMVLMFDGDEAGIRAATRTLELFIGFGTMPKVVALPPGEDPDSMVKKEGKKAFESRMTETVSLFEFFVDNLVRQKGFDPAGRVAAIGEAVPFLRMMKNPVEHGVYAKILASKLGVDEADVRKAAAAKTRAAKAGIVPDGVAPGLSEGVFSAERVLVRALLSNSELVPEVFEKISPDDFRDEWCRTVALMFARNMKEKGKIDIGGLISETGDALLAAQIRSEAMQAPEAEEDEILGLIKDCVSLIVRRPAKERLKSINDEIRRAELDDDESRVVELLKEKNELALHKNG